MASATASWPLLAHIQARNNCFNLQIQPIKTMAIARDRSVPWSSSACQPADHSSQVQLSQKRPTLTLSHHDMMAASLQPSFALILQPSPPSKTVGPSPLLRLYLEWTLPAPPVRPLAIKPRIPGRGSTGPWSLVSNGPVLPLGPIPTWDLPPRSKDNHHWAQLLIECKMALIETQLGRFRLKPF